MRGNERAKDRLWRWRSNPMRRREDIVEAWVVLAVWVVVAVGGTVAGLVTAHAADEVLSQQRAERRSVRAVLLTDVPHREVTVRAADDKALAKVRWTAPDGSTHTGRTLVNTGQKAGAGLTVWQDGRGTLTTPPPSPTGAAVEAGVLGTAAGLALTGATLAAGAVARWRLDQRRITAWDREWESVGPTWGHKTG
ncbi:Rv1733c family protein [Streptomyces resistomycificus]|uniref:Membrane protein n=1 Tax=Streptomyces resistomycificus TaxID=67356 RepID=A0A0L8LFS1_9ACTN|nr:hypothetical protein [Streptomyces resistomycificus]KOG37098.1 membrane protein [Streptomyces resistomycificus]KUN95045.1 hypothetical protein AQJ84_23490 [Streptomyces resistomycificus]